MYYIIAYIGAQASAKRNKINNKKKDLTYMQIYSYIKLC